MFLSRGNDQLLNAKTEKNNIEECSTSTKAPIAIKQQITKCLQNTSLGKQNV